jgi:alpha-beta hydrolase superfamily lysophospholipase
MRKLLRLLKWALVLLAVVLALILVIRTWKLERGPPLAVWHSYSPPEPDAADIARLDWNRYIEIENELFADVRENVTEKLEPQDRILANRYNPDSPIYPGNFTTDFNRSFILEPDGEPIGSVVLLHGLTDTPYSLRHIASHYRDRGFVAVSIRLPAHGTVPAALTEVEWEDWSAATRLAVREARRLAPGELPLHMVGYSNGGALAMKYSLDALDAPELDRPDRIVLVSPMIGIHGLAGFAGVLGWPAILPRFAKTAWLGIVPEFNPFKYNSFPINGARQAALLTRELQEQIDDAARDGRLEALAPVLTFHSLVDFSVSTAAVVSALYARLPANGSELVLFDLNRNARLGPLLRPSFEGEIERLLPPAPRAFRATIITNARPGVSEEVERVVEPGATEQQTRTLDLVFPPSVFSLSHIALPFPVDDSLYGLVPSSEEFGVKLGAISARGEVGALIVTLDSLVRISSNPFFPYMLERIEEGLPAAR